MDRTSPGLGYGEDLGFSNNPIKSDTDSSRLDPDCQQRLFRSSSSRRSHRSCCGGLPNSNIPGGPSSLVRPSAISSPDKTSADHSADRSPRHSDFPMETTLDQLARLSSLCAELKHILDSLCQTGHVAVMVSSIASRSGAVDEVAEVVVSFLLTLMQFHLKLMKSTRKVLESRMNLHSV